MESASAVFSFGVWYDEVRYNLQEGYHLDPRDVARLVNHVLLM